MHLVAAFVLTLVLAGAYLGVHIAFAYWIAVHGRKTLGRLVAAQRDVWRVQLRAVSTLRIWTTLICHLGGLLGFWWLVRQPLSLLALALLLLGYIFFSAVLTLSLLAQLPLCKKAWEGPVLKLGLVALPTVVAFLANAYAGLWLGELLGASAAHASISLFAATVFLWCLLVAIILAVAAVAFEVATLVVLGGDRRATRRGRRLGLVLLLLFSFMSAYLGANMATELPSGRLGSVMLAASVFEFDAAPADHCELSPHERALVRRQEPLLKALFLAGNHDKALLLQRPAALFRPLVLAELTPAERSARTLQVIRVAACFQVQAPR